MRIFTCALVFTLTCLITLPALANNRSKERVLLEGETVDEVLMAKSLAESKRARVECEAIGVIDGLDITTVTHASLPGGKAVVLTSTCHFNEGASNAARDTTVIIYDTNRVHYLTVDSDGLHFHGVVVEGTDLYVFTYEWLDTDAHCCPSLARVRQVRYNPATTQLEVMNSTLTKIK